MKEVTELPILDAFGRPIKIDQIWLPKLTLNNNFPDVARFDRCTTCHQAIDKTAPGSAHRARLPDPTDRDALAGDAGQRPAELLNKQSDRAESKAKHTPGCWKQIYGLQLANDGLLDSDDVTISVVRPETPAAKADLNVGDVIADDRRAEDPRPARWPSTICWSRSSGAQPLTLTVRRGLPNPLRQPPAARSVRRLAQPTQDGRHRLHDLPRRAGQRHGVQMGVALAERSAAWPRVEARARLVRQPSLDLPDVSRAVCRKLCA